jgi:cold shock CspA family protein
MSYNNNRGYNRSDSTASSRSGGGGRRGNRRRSVDTSTMPLEQGIICNLKESFGFIHCAERPEEIFFHYSEVTNCHPDDLQVDTEVEFRVGYSERDPTKLSAYAVLTLEAGTVVWESEEEPEKFYQGLVERNVRSDSRRGPEEGSIEVSTEDVPEEAPDEGRKKKGPIVRFRPDDVIPSKKSRSNQLFRGDLVQFRIFLDHRTKQKYARNITVLKTEKERAREERERKLMESATEEDGMVISLNKGYGFLKTNKRRPHVYFHYSNLILPEDQADFELKKGQEVKCLVVSEIVDGQTKYSARNLECLPKGSVQFHTDVAKGVKGIVTLCPQPPSAGSNPGYADDKDGSIILLEPLTDKDAEGNETTITEVSFEFNDAPGGVYTFQQRGTPTNGLWILEGDTLLFDVVKELADGSYQAAPTKHSLAVGGTVEEPVGENANDDKNACIRLAACSLASRAEGTMHTLKMQGGYGFIHFAERPIDVHFQTYNLMPEELASDLRKQLGYPGDEVKVEVGVGAQFDICAHGTVHSGGRGGGGGASRGRRGSPHERENVKAHRILTLPQLAVKMDKVLGKGVKGMVKSADARQLYAGFVDLDEEIKPLTSEERHPLVAQMIDSFIEESSKPHGRQQLVFRDVLSMKDDEVVVEMVQDKGKGVLTYDHIPVAGMDPRSGRLIIKRVKEGSEAPALLDEEEKANTKMKAGLHPPNTNIRFDKSSLSEELKEELPPNPGDIIVCDVVQSRRTGKVSIDNFKIVERSKEVPIMISLNGSAQNESPGVGVVQNVVPKSNFGFISVLAEKATRQELLFFSLSGDKNSRNCLFRKGDEVKFDIGVDPRTGKRMAKNVEIVAKGTIPSKPSNNACRGIVLMEPTHTSLSNTPLRKKSSGESLGGRWGNTKDDPLKVQAEIHETGVILLLEDKTGMFSKKRTLRSRKRSGSMDSTDSADEASVDDASTDNDSMDDDRSVESGLSSDGDHTGAILSHLSYKNGAIAIHGTGSGSGMDASANPRRGDIVTFVKARKGSKVRDIRIESRRAATLVRGRLENVQVQDTGESKKNAGSARFFAATEKEETYEIDLGEVVSCDSSRLKEKQQVEGILHDGTIYGICRTSDLYLESKLGAGHKERPRLNLAVKKDRGGRIMAQSMMATGPDSTNGFAQGWTTRTSQYANMLNK